MGRGGAADTSKSLLYGSRQASRTAADVQRREQDARLARLPAELDAGRWGPVWRVLNQEIADHGLGQDHPFLTQLLERAAASPDLDVPAELRSAWVAELKHLLFEDRIRLSGRPALGQVPGMLLSTTPGPATMRIVDQWVERSTASPSTDRKGLEELGRGLNEALREEFLLPEADHPALAQLTWQIAAKLVTGPGPKTVAARTRSLNELVAGHDPRIVSHQTGTGRVVHLRGAEEDPAFCGTEVDLEDLRWRTHVRGSWPELASGAEGVEVCRSCRAALSRADLDLTVEDRDPSLAQLIKIQGELEKESREQLKQGQELWMDIRNDLSKQAAKSMVEHVLDQLMELEPEERVRRLVTPRAFAYMKSSGVALPDLTRDELRPHLLDHWMNPPVMNSDEVARNGIADYVAREHGCPHHAKALDLAARQNK